MQTETKQKNYEYILIELFCIVLQVDVLESQFSQLLQQINSTRDFESIRLAHDHFLSNLLAQSFILLKPVSVQNKSLCIPDSVLCFWLNIHFICLPGVSLFEWNSGPVSQLLFPGQSESWASGWKRNSPAGHSCEGSFACVNWFWKSISDTRKKKKSCFGKS